MRLKPKSTVHNARALLYKRFTAIEQSMTSSHVYKTIDEKLWIYDYVNLRFVEIQGDNITVDGLGVIEFTDPNVCLVYRNTTYIYTFTDGIYQWVIDEKPEKLSVMFSNIAKYQTNKYYFVGSFDYMIKGGIESGETQIIKGAITPLTSFTIKYFPDDIKIDHDDLLVLDGKLYAVQSLSMDRKMQPRPFNVYFADVTSIL